MGREYVPVILYVKDGKITPVKFKSVKYDTWVTVLDITEPPRRMASLRAGAVGIRYRCLVTYNEMKREIYLFDEENDNWFIEDGEENNIVSEKADKKYRDCPNCSGEILTEPIIEKHQGRFSVLCPYCRSYRSGNWAATKEEAVASWNNGGLH